MPSPGPWAPGTCISSAPIYQANRVHSGGGRLATRERCGHGLHAHADPGPGLALLGERAGQTPLRPHPAWLRAPSPETVDAVPLPPLALGTTPSSIHRRMAAVTSDSCQASPVQFRGTEWRGPGCPALWPVLAGRPGRRPRARVLRRRLAVAGSREPGTSSIRCHQGHCRWSRLRLWYLICLHLIRAPPPGRGQGKGLGHPTPPQAPQPACLHLPPAPIQGSASTPSQPPAPGPWGLSVALSLLAPRAGFSLWAGGKPWA